MQKSKRKAFRAFTQKALSRAIQFAIIQRNYYITRKRRGQGALFGRVLVICRVTIDVRLKDIEKVIEFC